MIYLIILYIFIFGLIIGSFLNCLIWRMHEDESLLNRSYCPKCKNKIAWYDNIPVLSFLFLHGKCRKCQKKISFQYPLVEIITALFFVISFIVNTKILNNSLDFNLDFNYFSFNFLKIFRDFFIIAVMIVIFIYDLKWSLILDRVTLPAIVIIFFTNLALGISWQNLVISAIIGISFFLLQFIISKGKWIGGGDIRLGFLMGVIFGWPMILMAIFLAYIIGSVIGIGLILNGNKKLSSKVPLGTFLSVASVIVLFWGDLILNWYLSIIY